MTAWYNEVDPFAAQWLRNLVAAGHIAPGVVDERSIEDVCPDDLRAYTQCHFFAGIGVWSAALRAAGVSDDTPLWTGSCPCQPFSQAGKGDGFADERHLWPAWHWLIAQLLPVAVFGEQVASKDGLAWLDLVQTDMEALGYACGATVFPAAGVGAPHGRHRTYFVAHPSNERHERIGRARRWRDGPSDHGAVSGMAHPSSRDTGAERQPPCRQYGLQSQVHSGVDPLVNAGCSGLPERECDGRVQREALGAFEGQAAERGSDPGLLVHPESEQARISRCARERRATSGVWTDADWIECRGDKWRPVEPGTFPLAHGYPQRVGRVRAYGNAICLPQARAFIEAYLDTRA